MLRILLTAFCLLAGATAFAGDAKLPGWIAGAWELQSKGKWGDEYWTPPRGGVMIGAGRVGKDNKLSSFESMRIGFDENGKLAFWAFPNWSAPHKFPMIKQSDTEIVFENAEHDYPQRVRYWREGKALRAEISLIDGSNAIRYDFKPMGGR